MTCPFCQAVDVQKEESGKEVVALYSCDDCGSIWRWRGSKRHLVIVFTLRESCPVVDGS